MKTNIHIDGKSILILILVGVIVLGVIFNNDISRLLGQKKAVVKELVEVEKELSQGIKDSLELIPVYEARIAELEAELESVQGEVILIHEYADSLQYVIDNNTVTEDMVFYAEYIEADTMPQLLRVPDGDRVIITPLQLKRTNHIFVSHDAYAKERPLLLKSISTLEQVKAEQRREITTLMNTIGNYDRRYETNQDIILAKDEIIKLQRKQKRRRTFGMIGAGLIGFGVGVIIFK